MSGKYAKKKQKNRKFPVWILVVVIVLVVGAAAAALLLPRMNQPEKTTGQTLPRPDSTAPADPGAETEQTTPTVVTIPVETHNVYDLGNGLEINQIDSYAGIYMEDGSDEVVSGVLMISLTNHGEQDLQLARVRLTYEEGEALFEVTNLPAGATAILLEKNRMEATEAEPLTSEAENVLFFAEPMNCQEDRFLIGGSSGMLTVENISGEDIEGDIYVYYKNSAADQFFGGITYRAKVSGGLKAGETATMMASHYSPDMCTVVMVEAAE